MICDCDALGIKSPAICSTKKLIVGHVAIEGIDDPVTPLPLLAFEIFFVTIGIRVTSSIEPMASPLLTKTFAGEQFFDGCFEAGDSNSANSLGEGGSPIRSK